jgi:peptidoglycan L-alanyl-D-glutamate endopeptidase CwlK
MKLEQLHPQTRRKLEAMLADPEASALGLKWISGYRSFAEQDRLYAQGRGAAGPRVTNAKGGQSFHNVRRAVDLAPAQLLREPNWAPTSPLWLRLGLLYECYGLKWGGRWRTPDRPHGEDSFCLACGRDVGPSAATHFSEDGECREAKAA